MIYIIAELKEVIHFYTIEKINYMFFPVQLVHMPSDFNGAHRHEAATLL